MTIRRGEIVLLAFPLSDGVGGTVRPAVVVQSDADNRQLKNTIVAMMTSSVDGVALQPTHLLIDVDAQEGKQSGLLHTSVITCENLLTVEQRLIVRTIGTVPRAVMARVDQCLNKALGLSA